jgi:SAM-dependent methyltransferase
LPFPDATADVVTSFDVLYCLSDQDEEAALREMYRVLKPNGIVLIHVAALDILHGSHSALTHEVRRYTPARLSSRLTRAGFVVERMSFTNMLTFPLALTVRWMDRVRGRAAVASDADLRVPSWPVNALLSAALAAEGVMLRGVNLPIGSSLMCLARKR